ncbi:MAG TPA: hypothetical protein VFG45_00620 [Candidatus Nitrosocosmicus sp.]|nr:hypothetical protein [Candidatus Nitrosocosmicus sp.]
MNISNAMDKNPNYKVSKSKSKSKSNKLIKVIPITHKHPKLMTRSVSIMIIYTLVLLLPIMTVGPVAYAEKKITRGAVNCGIADEENGVDCCQEEVDEDGINLMWCTHCNNINPPSDCGERYLATKPNPHTGTHSNGGKTLQQPDSSDTDNKNDIRTNILNKKGGSLAQ